MSRRGGNVGGTRDAFTLIEILVVVAITTLLITLLLPSLRRTRDQARNTVCKSNQRQVLVGMTYFITENRHLPATQKVYAMDNVARLPDGYTWSGAGYGDGHPLAVDYADDSDWLTAYAKSTPQKGTVYRHVKDDKAYLCPSDRSGRGGSGGGNGRLSYSMNAFMGLRKADNLRFTYVADFSPTSGSKRPRIPAGTSIRWPESGMMVLFEEDPLNSLNRAGNVSGGRGDGDMLDTEQVTARHQVSGNVGRTNVGFLDSHMESRLINSNETHGWRFYDEMRMPYLSDQDKVGAGRNLAAFVGRVPSNLLPR